MIVKETKTKDPLSQEVTRSMKHLLIRDLLRYRLRVSSPIGLRYGADLDVSDWVNEILVSIPMAIRTASLTNHKGTWRYAVTVPSREKFPTTTEFIWALVFEEYDDIRPSYYLMTNEELEKYIESKLKKAKSWKEDENYTFHPTREAFDNEFAPHKGFDLIDTLLGRPKPDPFIRPSQEYWDSGNWIETNRIENIPQ